MALCAGDARWQAVGVRGRDGQPHLAGPLVRLLASRQASLLQDTEKQRQEHHPPSEHQLRRYGPFDGYLEAPTSKEVFKAYVEHFLAPKLRLGQVVVMDNLGVHKGERVRELIEGRGCKLLYLPPYSPDLNPIEEAFSKIKGFLRQIGARTREALVEAIGKALNTVTTKDAWGFFAHCGYRILA